MNKHNSLKREHHTHNNHWRSHMHAESTPLEMNIACLCVQKKTWILPFQTGCIDLARVCLCQPFAAFPPKRLRANILDTPLLTFGCQGKCCFLNYLEASTNLNPRYNSTNLKPRYNSTILKPRSQHRAAKQITAATYAIGCTHVHDKHDGSPGLMLELAAAARPTTYCNSRVYDPCNR